MPRRRRRHRNLRARRRRARADGLPLHDVSASTKFARRTAQRARRGARHVVPARGHGATRDRRMHAQPGCPSGRRAGRSPRAAVSPRSASTTCSRGRRRGPALGEVDPLQPDNALALLAKLPATPRRGDRRRDVDSRAPGRPPRRRPRVEARVRGVARLRGGHAHRAARRGFLAEQAHAHRRHARRQGVPRGGRRWYWRFAPAIVLGEPRGVLVRNREAAGRARGAPVAPAPARPSSGLARTSDRDQAFRQRHRPVLLHGRRHAHYKTNAYGRTARGRRPATTSTSR